MEDEEQIPDQQRWNNLWYLFVYITIYLGEIDVLFKKTSRSVLLGLKPRARSASGFRPGRYKTRAGKRANK
jgi:hypothetical protein